MSYYHTFTVLRLNIFSNWTSSLFFLIRIIIVTSIQANRFDPQVCQIGTQWDKSGNFAISFQYILARWAKMHGNLIVKFSNLSHWVPIYSTLDPNLTHMYQFQRPACHKFSCFLRFLLYFLFQMYIKGHSGDAGNDAVDILAKKGASKPMS